MLNAVMAQRDALQAIPQPSLPTSVGLPRAILDPLDPGVESAFTTVIELLRGNGVSLVDVDWPDDDVLQAVGFILMMAESAEFHRERMAESEKFDPEIAELLQMGNLISATDYIRARRVQVAIAEHVGQVFERVPVVITPTLPCPPAPYGSGTFTPLSVGDASMPLAAAHTRFPLLANVAGLPAGTVPCGLASGLPVGLQIIGPPGQGDLVLSAMAGIEKVLADAGIWQVGTTSTGDRE
jgi:aspartyl-tRNA(Asn)/glutamyl-tRNA(Gln) amidotransferase subunit A